jgi:dTDP-4-dehydrorhamnose reductase
VSGRDARWLVTGAGGQLGRSLLGIAGPQAVDAAGLTRDELDITDAKAIERALGRFEPDVVLNAAAYTKVDACEEDADLAMRVNGDGPARLADACRGRALLVQVSTEYVFAGDASRPIPEDAEPRPLSAYGRSKLAGELAVRDSGCEHLIVRTQWLFGPGPNFVRTILRAAGSGQKLRVVEDQVGRPTWTHALAEGLVAAVRGELRGTLHLACEGLCSWYDFAREIVAGGVERGLVPAVEVDPIATSEMPRPARRPPFAALGLERARSAGVRLPHWRDALASYLDGEG